MFFRSNLGKFSCWIKSRIIKLSCWSKFVYNVTTWTCLSNSLPLVPTSSYSYSSFLFFYSFYPINTLSNKERNVRMLLLTILCIAWCDRCYKVSLELYFKVYDALNSKTIEKVSLVMAKTGHIQPLMNLSWKWHGIV